MRADAHLLLARSGMAWHWTLMDFPTTRFVLESGRGYGYPECCISFYAYVWRLGPPLWRVTEDGKNYDWLKFAYLRLARLCGVDERVPCPWCLRQLVESRSRLER